MPQGGESQPSISDMVDQAAYHNLCDQKGGRGGEKAMMDDYDNEFKAIQAKDLQTITVLVLKEQIVPSASKIDHCGNNQ